jgi:hypothetical protein
VYVPGARTTTAPAFADCQTSLGTVDVRSNGDTFDENALGCLLLIVTVNR